VIFLVEWGHEDEDNRWKGTMEFEKGQIVGIRPGKKLYIAEKCDD